MDDNGYEWVSVKCTSFVHYSRRTIFVIVWERARHSLVGFGQVLMRLSIMFQTMEDSVSNWRIQLFFKGNDGIIFDKCNTREPLHIPCLSFMYLCSTNRRGSVICSHSCWEEHLSHSFSLNNREYYPWCTLSYQEKKIWFKLKFVALAPLAVMCVKLKKKRNKEKYSLKSI